MSTTTSLPTLFGRITVIATEHERLGETLGRISAMCTTLESEHPDLTPDLQPGPLLVALLAELSEHFAAEEADAYFGALVQDRPTFAPQIAELRAEHRAMLETVRALCEIATKAPGSRGLSSPTWGLIARLRAHERTESELLREFFS